MEKQITNESIANEENHITQMDAGRHTESKGIAAWIKAGYFWVMATTVTAALSIAAMILYPIKLLFPKMRYDYYAHGCAMVWAKSLIHMMPGWKVNIIDENNTLASVKNNPSEPVIFVANHSSMADIWAIYFLDTQFRWLSKKSVFDIPLVGTSMKLARYVAVTRGQASSHTQALMESKQRLLEDKVHMVFFPEGTRSKDLNNFKPFKVGAFKLAIETGCPIVPIAIKGAGNLLPKNSAFPSSKADVNIKILAKRSYSAKDLDKISELAADVREEVLTAYRSLS